jgi:hypothetical protein
MTNPSTPRRRWRRTALATAGVSLVAAVAPMTGVNPARRDSYGEIDENDVRTTMKRARLNRSAALGKILDLFSANPDREFRAIDFSHEAGLSPGSVHPILDKLQRARVIEVIRYGDPAPASIKRYRLTDFGARFALRYRVAVGVTV